MRHIILISGKDSLATAILMKELKPDVPYEYVFNETGAELPEVNEWLCKVEQWLEKPIIRIGENLETLIYEQGILPSATARYCSRIVKLMNTEQYVGEDEATIYYGIRADENRPGYIPMGNTKIIPCYPLQEHRIGIQEVLTMLHHLGLMPPKFFWQRVFDEVCERLGSNVKWLDNLTPWERDHLFAWRTRSNCYYCFFQRIYEFVGLLEHHPDLFWNAVEIEENTGGKNFYWVKDHSLRSIAKRADDVRYRRVKDICKIIAQVAQGKLFQDQNFTLLDITSCGLVCGK